MMFLSGWVVKWGDEAPSYKEIVMHGAVHVPRHALSVHMHHPFGAFAPASVTISTAGVRSAFAARIEPRREGLAVLVPILPSYRPAVDAWHLVRAGLMGGWSMEISSMRFEPSSRAGWARLVYGRLEGVALVVRPAYRGSVVWAGEDG